MTKITGKKAPSVLVLGEDTRSFLSVIRSLGKSGYLVHIVSYNKKCRTLKSKYIASSQFYNYQAFSQSEWLHNAISLILRYLFALVVPCDKRAIYPLCSTRDKTPSHTKLTITNQEALDILFDKWQTKRAAITCNIPVAQGRELEFSAFGYAQLQYIFGEKFVVKALQPLEQSRLNKQQIMAIVEYNADYIAHKHNNVIHSQPYLVEILIAGKGNDYLY